MTTKTLISTSVAHRLEAGTYSPCLAANLRAKMPAAAPSSPVASVSAPLWTYAAAAALGAVIGLLLAS